MKTTIVKKSFALLSIVVAVGLLPLLFSCQKTKEVKSLTEMLKDEEKVIKSFIAKEGFTVEKAQDGQTEFKSGVYYLFKNNLYMMILDKGGERPVAEKTRVNVRMKGYMFSSERGASFDNLSNGGYQDAEFLYVDRYNRGAVHFQSLTSAPGYTVGSLICEGIAFPMSILGDGARVSLIIPFSIGPTMNYDTGTTMFCSEVRYEFSRY